ncbi:hypothetical protein DMUE_0601 [Dictyocoela muelleri]|nr:hypothetical protein DMUE_0601 [Dictyocoela muelleri]
MRFISYDNLVFLDETGINLNQSRNYNYSPKNTKAVKIVKNSRGKNVSCMVAIKKSGIVTYQIKDGPFNGDTFINFIENNLLFHFQNNRTNIIGIDNCSFHHSRDVIALLENKNINIRF